MTDVDRSAIEATVADRLEIGQLESDYCRYFDERNGEAWSQLYTERGRYRSRGTGPGTEPVRGVYVEGREALERFCREAPFRGIHLLHLPTLAFDGDTATGRLHFEHLGAFDGREGMSRSVGFYDVRYERVDGAWLFADKVTTVFCRDDVIVHGYPASAFDDD